MSLVLAGSILRNFLNIAARRGGDGGVGSTLTSSPSSSSSSSARKLADAIVWRRLTPFDLWPVRLDGVFCGAVNLGDITMSSELDEIDERELRSLRFTLGTTVRASVFPAASKGDLDMAHDDEDENSPLTRTPDVVDEDENDEERNLLAVLRHCNGTCVAVSPGCSAHRLAPLADVRVG